MKIRNVVMMSILLFLGAFLTSCYPPQPKETQNICDIFQQYPDWYWDALKTQQKWGVSVATQMAIMYVESGFQASAEPPARKKIWKILPWHRETTAYGYCQALQNTWEDYQKCSGQYTARDDFAAASDFIGWYANQAYLHAHVSPADPYALYLAYHEGLGGYLSHSYWHKLWLIKVAHTVEYLSIKYQAQLQQCASSIPKPSLLQSS